MLFRSFDLLQAGMLRNGPLESWMSKDTDIEYLQTYLESWMSKDTDEVVFASDSWLLATAYVNYCKAAVAKSTRWLQRTKRAVI